MLDFPRKTAGLIGIVSTWWFGLFIGVFIGIFGLLQPTTKTMWRGSYGAIIWTLGIVRVFVGMFVIANLDIDWRFPANLKNPKSFLTAATMHNFSYLGGIIGLIYGILHQRKIKKAST